MTRWSAFALALTLTTLGADSSGMAAQPDAASSAGSAGWRVFRDPATGAPSAPESGSVPADAVRRMPDAATPLAEQRTPDGQAVFVDLHGQFRHAVRVNRPPGSTATIECQAGAPAAAADEP